MGCGISPSIPAAACSPWVVKDKKLRPKGQPAIKDNLVLASNSPAQLKQWYAEHIRREDVQRVIWGLSLKKSSLVAIDVDCGPGKVGEQSFATLVKEHGPFPLTEVVTSPSGGRHLIYKGEHHFSTDQLGDNIDTPNYVLIEGTAFDDGRAYVLKRDVPVAPLPQWVAEKIKPHHTERRNFSGDAIPFDVYNRMLDATPYAGGPAGLNDRHGYQGWLLFAMEVHEAAGGDEGDYLNAFIEWSGNDPHAKASWTPESIEKHWRSFTADPPEGSAARTRASWFKLLTELGHPEFVAEQYTPEMDFGDDEEPDWSNVTPLRHPSVTDEVIAAWKEKHRKKREEKRQQEQAKQNTYHQGYTADELADAQFAPQEEIIEGMLLEGKPQTIDGDGGVGKSTVGAQAAVHRAAGKPMFGRKVKQGNAIFITHEDDYNVVKARMEATAKYLGLPEVNGSRLRGLPLRVICNLEDDLRIAVIEDSGKWTKGPFYDTLDELMGEMPGALVFMDCLEDFKEGDFLTKRAVPNAFYKVVLAQLAKRHNKATPVMLCHPSKAAMESGDFYEGNTANRTAVRGKLVMKLVSKKDVDGPRWFGNLKRQYGPNGGLVKVVFNDEYGIFTPDTDPNLTAETLEAYATIVEKALELIKQGITVCKHNQSSGQGPSAIAKAIAEDDPDALEPDPKDVIAALEWGERRGKIRHIPSNKNKRIKEHYERPEPSESGAA